MDHYLTMTEAGARIRAGGTSSVALTRAMLDRIEALNGTLNAYVTVTPELALQQAEQADREFADGRDRGPLHGIPVAVKDLFATEGVRTTCGSKLFEDWVPERDAAAVAKLREAGAVMLGKTGLHELAYGITSNNPHFGAISNPWALDHHPGGSSGGSAAAVAAGLAYVALGSDTGCSIRQPAHCCGIVGHKPTFGLVSKAGALPLTWTMDHVGPMARSVEDAALMLNAIAGYDAEDPYSVQSSRPLEFHPGEVSLKGARLGIVRAFFFEGGEPEVVGIVEAALETFRELGSELVEIELPDLDEAFRATRAIFAEVLAVHARDFEERPEAFGPDVARKLEATKRQTAADYASAQHFRRLFRSEVERRMSDCEVLLAPTATVPAWPIAEEPPDYGLYGWRNTGIFDFTGQPSVSIPCGFTQAGLPVGLMITGRPFEDQTVFRVAKAYETVTEWHKKRPPI